VSIIFYWLKLPNDLYWTFYMRQLNWHAYR